MLIWHLNSWVLYSREKDLLVDELEMNNYHMSFAPSCAHFLPKNFAIVSILQQGKKNKEGLDPNKENYPMWSIVIHN